MSRLRFPSPATVLACIALFVALGGTGYAALRSPDHSSHAAAAKAKRKPITTKTVNRLIRRYFQQKKATLVGPQGPQGATGPQGAAGAAGAAATKLFLQIDSRNDPPTAIRQSGVSSIDGPTQTGVTGYYEVTFQRDLTNCVAVASAGSRDGNFPGLNTAAVSHADTNIIGVQIANNAGAQVNADFSLAVFC